ERVRRLLRCIHFLGESRAAFSSYTERMNSASSLILSSLSSTDRLLHLEVGDRGGGRRTQPTRASRYSFAPPPRCSPFSSFFF
ncbi:hypothetical protein PMAYCL1PPCAC_13632, partial [Pristionchus mayeri]